MGLEHPCPWCGYPGPHQQIPVTFGAGIPEAERQRFGSHRVLCGQCQIQEVYDPPEPPGDGVTTLDLRLVPPAGRDAARRDLDAGDAGGFLCYVESHQAWTVFVANHRLLKARGLYEVCLLDAYSMVKGNLRGWPTAVIDGFFLHAHPGTLRAAGDPVPTPPPPMLYRGVGGRGPARRVRGLSWTSDLATAAWFALRFDLPEPAVYQLPFWDGGVLAYDNGRHEQEYLLSPLWLAIRRPRRLRLTPEDLHGYRAQREARRRD